MTTHTSILINWEYYKTDISSAYLIRGHSFPYSYTKHASLVGFALSK